MEENIYYVYAYLDPRKPGTYNYGNYTFDHEPFYIGKGKGGRMYRHIKDIGTNRACNTHKINKINKLFKLGLEPIVIQVVKNLPEEEALEQERVLVELIGRTVNNTGVLTNLSEGGKPQPELSTEGRAKQGEAVKRRVVSDETKAKIGAAGKGRKKSPESVARTAAAHRGKKRSPEACAKMSASKKGKKLSPEECARRSEAAKGQWVGEKNPMYGKHWPEEQKVRANLSRSKYIWYIILPSGEIVTTRILTDFTKEHGLSSAFYVAIENGVFHKGYLGFKFPKDEMIY